ncbi:hypothetical protein FGO68_gene15347 [Halteria grandinella]|uniref:Uncharacterized protein n=1 Tax=Halteria grandinella TaxID=5974 RepID=A0A8J8T199_HALGN|nr:hypothetical protein FGO68_gene15347 [Halteria grandinella]
MEQNKAIMEHNKAKLTILLKRKFTEGPFQQTQTTAFTQSVLLKDVISRCIDSDLSPTLALIQLSVEKLNGIPTPLRNLVRFYAKNHKASISGSVRSKSKTIIDSFDKSKKFDAIFAKNCKNSSLVWQITLDLTPTQVQEAIIAFAEVDQPSQALLRQIKQCIFIASDAIPEQSKAIALKSTLQEMIDFGNNIPEVSGEVSKLIASAESRSASPQESPEQAQRGHSQGNWAMQSIQYSASLRSLQLSNLIPGGAGSDQRSVQQEQEIIDASLKIIREREDKIIEQINKIHLLFGAIAPLELFARDDNLKIVNANQASLCSPDLSQVTSSSYLFGGLQGRAIE